VFCGRNIGQLATLPPHGAEKKGARTPVPEGPLLMIFSSISAVCMIKRIANENPCVGAELSYNSYAGATKRASTRDSLLGKLPLSRSEKSKI
jgi:hypothetical protein